MKNEKFALKFVPFLRVVTTRTAARKVVSSLALIGPFKISTRSNSTADRAPAQIQTGSRGSVARDKNITGC